MSDKKPTCDSCGWPLYEDVKDGCVAGNCSQRPLPPPGPIGESGPNDPNGGPVGLSPSPLPWPPPGKMPIRDDIFYEGHLGWYDPSEQNAVEAKRLLLLKERQERRDDLFSRCLVIATIGNRTPDILSIRQPHRKFRMEIIDHGDAHREGLGAYNWKGYKWHNINRMFASGLIKVEDYDYFFFPDDDVLMDCEDVHRMFLLAHQHGLRLFQPSMAADSTNIGWPVTKHVPGSIVRMTNFVEILAPCFSAEALKICLPTFLDNFSGWGLDFVWPKLLDYEGVGVIDTVQMRHTGVGTSGDWTMPNGLKPGQELHQTMGKYWLNYAVLSRNVASF